MSVYISTNLYRPLELSNIFTLIEKIEGVSIGIELFPEWHDETFVQTLYQNAIRFKSYPSTLHGPYYYTEHSEKKGTLAYERSKNYFIKTLELAQELKSRYIVYHHNNCKISSGNRSEIMKVSSENLLELNMLAKVYGTAIVVENAGVRSHQNMLFDEEAFIEMALYIENNILIDIGHAFANNWNLAHVVEKLKDKITAYHVHNNDGVQDLHLRMRDGGLGLNDFMMLYANYTPHAELVLEYNKSCSADSEGIIQDVYELNHLIYP